MVTGTSSSQSSAVVNARDAKLDPEKRFINQIGLDDNIFPWNLGMSIRDESKPEYDDWYHTIGEHIQEGLFIIEGNNLVYVNDRASEIFGYPKDELIKLSSLDIAAPEEKERLKHINNEIDGNDTTPRDLELWIISKNGTRRFIHNHYSFIRRADNSVSRLLITNDITEHRQAEEDLKKRMMKYKLEDGRFYLAKESTPSLTLEAFKDILNVGYNGLVISRTPEKYFRKGRFENTFDFLWLAEKGEENCLNPKLHNIEFKIRNLAMKTVVLLDGIEYLVFKNGFNKTLSLMQRLREYIYISGNIIIMCLDPSTLNRQELRLLEKECTEIEVRLSRENLPKEQLKILRSIYQNNSLGIKPSYTNIGQELGISKPTVRKRIRQLISSGYILEDIRGRNKIVELTVMGRNLFLG